MRITKCFIKSLGLNGVPQGALNLLGINLMRKVGRVAGLREGLMTRSCQGQECFTNAFCSNLKTVNLKVFDNHEGAHSEDKVLTSLQN